MYLITTRATPEPFLWEMALIPSALPAFIGWSALAKV